MIIEREKHKNILIILIDKNEKNYRRYIRRKKF